MLSQHLGAVTNTIALLPMASISASANGTGIDVTDYVGSIAISLSAKNVSGTAPTLIVKIQDSPDNSTFTDIAGAVFVTVTDAGTLAATLEKISVRADSAAKFIRAVMTAAGTTPVFLVSCHAIGVKQYR